MEFFSWPDQPGTLTPLDSASQQTLGLQAYAVKSGLFLYFEKCCELNRNVIISGKPGLQQKNL